MQQEKGFIKYIVIIGVIITIVFLSQLPYFREVGKNLTAKASDAVYGYWAKGADWATSVIYPKVSEEVKNRGEMIKNEITSEKDKISENVLQKVGDYFSGIADSVVHPGNNSCTTNQAPQ